MTHSPPSADALDEQRPAGGRTRRGPLLIIIAIVTVVLLGGTAFAAVRFWAASSVNPAERLPDSAVYYAEVNLDPGRDQTANLMRILENFDALENVTDIEDATSELLTKFELEDVDPDHITPWLGTRGAAALWVDEAGEDFFIALALASRDDGAARAGLAAVLEASDEEFGYVVEDGLATLVFADTDPQTRAEELVADGRANPLANSASFQSDVESLGGEQLAIIWFNTEQTAG